MDKDQLETLLFPKVGPSEHSGQIYLNMLLRAYVTQDKREEQINDCLMIMINNELEDVINEAMDALFFSDPDDIKGVCDKALIVLENEALHHLKKILNRHVPKARKGRYQGVMIEDLKFAAVMAYIFNLRDMAIDAMEDVIVNPDGQIPRLPPPEW